jgi:hypothetical protein
MRPEKPQTTGEGDLFRARIDQTINMEYELMRLAGATDWEWLDAEIAPLFSAKGRLASPTRFMIGLLRRPAGWGQATPMTYKSEASCVHCGATPSDVYLRG